ncbi:tRNA (adenosine(37)-N6)-threonylcarbamoyltransferase complex dimerization subunit type 1 TsaB [Patescibacteria group bacterium]
MLLAINTANSRSAIAIFSTEYKLIDEETWQSNNDEAEKLMPSIDRLLNDNDCNYDDIKEVVVVRGPGSFTGLRIGITVANMISFLNKTKLYALDTFEYLWQKMEEHKGVALLIYAGSGGVYLSLNNDNQNPKTINIDELAGILKKQGIKEVFGDISDEQKAKLGDDVIFLESKKSFGERIENFLNNNGENLKDHTIIKPNYIKSPGIKISKKKIF